jgi:hypothetical protein
MLQQEREQAQANLEKSLRTQTQGDMAALMARYGSQLALAQAGGVTGVSGMTPFGSAGKA